MIRFARSGYIPEIREEKAEILTTEEVANRLCPTDRLRDLHLQTEAWVCSGCQVIFEPKDKVIFVDLVRGYGKVLCPFCYGWIAYDLKQRIAKTHHIKKAGFYESN